MPSLQLCSAVDAKSSTLLGSKIMDTKPSMFYPGTLQDNVVLGLVKYPELRPISPGTAATFALTLSYLFAQPF